MIGSLLRIGIAAASSCDTLSSKPAIANDCPSRSSTSVSARRVVSAGIRNPPRLTPFAKSSVLTSGATFRRIASPAIVGVNFSRMPNSLNCHGHRAGGALHNRNRELAAGQEARLLPVVGNQVRLGEALKRAALLKRPHEHAVCRTWRSKKNRFRKSLNVNVPLVPSSKSGAENCCVVRPRKEALARSEEAKRRAPAATRRFTSAKRTCSSTCWLSLPPGTCSRLITERLVADAVRDLAGAQHHVRARDLTRKNRRVLARADLNVLTRKQRLRGSAEAS